jgi:hypothetical protein
MPGVELSQVTIIGAVDSTSGETGQVVVDNSDARRLQITTQRTRVSCTVETSTTQVEHCPQCPGNGQATFDFLATSLDTSIEIGEFTELLQISSAANGATATAASTVNETAAFSNFNTYVVPPNSSTTEDKTGTIVGATLGALFVVVGSVALYFWRTKGSTNVGEVDKAVVLSSTSVEMTSDVVNPLSKMDQSCRDEAATLTPGSVV